MLASCVGELQGEEQQRQRDPCPEGEADCVACLLKGTGPAVKEQCSSHYIQDLRFIDCEVRNQQIPLFPTE